MLDDDKKNESTKSGCSENCTQDKQNKPKKKIKSVRDVIIESIECEPGIEGCTADPDTCPNSPVVCDKKLSMFGYYNDAITDGMEHVLSKSMDELTKVFAVSARRWEMIVYPSLFAFILLSAYGFFLIYSLTHDVTIVAEQMVSISKDMHSVVLNMDTMSKNMVVMTQTVDSQSASMHEMNMHMRDINMSMNQMRYDLSSMTHNVSKPMSFMNSFLPW